MKFVFDVDDTVYDLSAPFKQAIRKNFPELKVDMEKLFIRSRYFSDEIFEDQMAGKVSLEDAYVYRITKALEEVHLNITKDQALSFQTDYYAFQKDIVMEPLMIELFDYLHKHDLLGGLITNGLSDHQKTKIKNLGLEKWLPMDKIIVSGDHEVNKPDKKIFEIAKKQFKLDIDQIYFIGDSFESDVIGALNAGWIPIWLNTRNKVKASDVKGDIHEVHSHHELFNLIKTLINTNE